MKRCFLLALLLWLDVAVASAQPVYTVLDTLDGLPPRYRASQWYEECPQFMQDTVHFIPTSLMLSNAFGTVCRRVVAVEQYTPAPQYVSGVAALVTIDVPAASATHEWAPEYVYLMQGKAANVMYPNGDTTLPPMHDYFTPREMEQVAVVRWDTVVPYVLRMPHLVSSIGSPYDTSYYYCYAYEAYFDAPVSIDSVYYLVGTFNSNTMDPTMGATYSHWPTAYFSMRQTYGDNCDPCPNSTYIYFNPVYPPANDYWAIHNDGIFMTPCLIPIVVP